MPVNIKDPDEEVLVAKQFDYIRNYLNQVERTLYADNFSLDGHSYTDYIDVNSFIDWWFVHELTLNGEPKFPAGFIKFFLVRIVRKVEPCAGQ